MNKPNIHFKDIELSPVSNRDLDSLCSLLWAPEIRKFLCDDQQLPRDTVQAFIEQSLTTDEKGYGFWGIWRSKNFIGLVGLNPIENNMAIEIADQCGVETLVAIKKSHWGNEIGENTLKQIHSFARTALRLPHVYAFIDVPNINSHRLYKKLGYTRLKQLNSEQSHLELYQLTLP